MTPYVYHRKPPVMRGSVLYPLNQLRTIHPEMYASSVAKYEGRERLLSRIIPKLDCLWNDVLHFSPVHPALVRDILKPLGGWQTSAEFFQVDATLLDPRVTVLWKHTTSRLLEEDIVPYDSSALESYGFLPEATVAYYKEKRASGGQPLLWHLVPHVLHKGTLDVRNVPVITV